MVSITPILAAKPGNRRAGIHIGVEKASSRTAIAFLAYNALVTGNTNHPMSSIVWDGVGNLTKGVK